MGLSGTKPLETKRLLLRRFALDDAKEMFANWANDPAVTQFMRWEPHPDAAFTRRLLEEWLPNYNRGNYYHWAIVLKETGQLIGSIGILPTLQPDEPEGWAPGYCIGQAFWGKGYTTEALCAVVNYYFDQPHMDELWCCHATANPASGRVMEKAGFRFQHNGVYHKPDGTKLPAKYYLCRRGEQEKIC